MPEEWGTTAAFEAAIDRIATAVPASSTPAARIAPVLSFMRSRPSGGCGGQRQGRVLRCGLTVLAKPLPLVTSQLIDQVIAPRMPGYVAVGWKLPQLAPPARQW